MILHAEAIYSENRLRALADEWSSDYQNLIELSFFLKHYSNQFKVSDLQSEMEERMLDFLINNPREDYIRSVVEDKFNSEDIDGFIQEMLKVLFRVGVMGVKPESYTSVVWSYLGQKLLGSEISKDATIYIHPAFWRMLGIPPV
jgi:hypothetical protein